VQLEWDTVMPWNRGTRCYAADVAQTEASCGVNSRERWAVEEKKPTGPPLWVGRGRMCRTWSRLQRATGRRPARRAAPPRRGRPSHAEEEDVVHRDVDRETGVTEA
jgi:hypothetical protein